MVGERGDTYRSYQKHQSLPQHNLPAARHLLDVSLITSLKPNLCTTVTTQNTAENKFIVSQAQNTTALRTNVFLTGIRRLLVINTGRSAFPRANRCQGQVQTPQSVPSKLNALVCYATYRVSIKSFPDYKQLLQKNYVEYKHILTWICLTRGGYALHLTHRTHRTL
jgi:hypothetical protein